MRTRTATYRHSVLILLLLLAGVSTGRGYAEELVSIISPARQIELASLLKQDCGSCHGMTLKGGLGPALTPQAIADKPELMLIETILAGRAGTPMPPWAPFLTRHEAEWLVKNLKKGVWAESLN